jgi:hypothetical protein
MTHDPQDYRWARGGQFLVATIRDLDRELMVLSDPGTMHG